ncbi:MAG TPA: hypothetical protein VLG76_05140 [Rhabdochlamydiaceae bacterium]|nr:hypothetical protein [Rhabdochlamydiaceae bacterium]
MAVLGPVALAANGAIAYCAGELLSSKYSINRATPKSEIGIRMIAAVVGLIAGAVLLSGTVAIVTGQVAYLPIAVAAGSALGAIRALYKIYNLALSAPQR